MFSFIYCIVFSVSRRTYTITITMWTLATITTMDITTTAIITMGTTIMIIITTATTIIMGIITTDTTIMDIITTEPVANKRQRKESRKNTANQKKPLQFV
ncbi:hypothetical protein QOT17_013033 [Balamuthia mandrillaris]